MKIQETVERECCTHEDFLPYKGAVARWVKPVHKLVFCKHCGQIWWHSKEMTGAGDYDPVLKKIVATFDEDD